MRHILLFMLFLCSTINAMADDEAWYLVTDTEVNIKMSTVSYLLASDNDDSFYVICNNGNIYGGVSSVTFAQMTSEAAGISEIEAQNTEVVIGGNEITLLGVTSSTPTVIYSIDGSMLKSKVLTESENSIYIGGLSPGVYILKSGDTTLKFRKK